MFARRTVAAAAILASLMLTGCDQDAETVAAPTETVTVTATVTAGAVPPEPEVETVTETVTVEPTQATEGAEEAGDDLDLDEDTRRRLAILAMETALADMSQAEVDDICLGWAVDENMMIDNVLEGAGPDLADVITRGDVADVIDAACADRDR